MSLFSPLRPFTDLHCFPLFSIPSLFVLDHLVLPEAEWVGGIVDSITEFYGIFEDNYFVAVLTSLSIQDATGMAVDLDNAHFFSISSVGSVPCTE